MRIYKSRPSADAARPLAAPSGLQISVLQALLLVCLASLYFATPALFGQAFLNSEEEPFFFSSVYDLTLFYPGSNRILSVLPFATSWAGTIRLSAEVEFWILVFSVAIGLVCFARWAVQPIAVVFLGIAFLILTLLFGGPYHFHATISQPYSYAFGMSLVPASWLLYRFWQGRPVPVWGDALLLAPIVLITGINPTTSLFWCIFFLAWLALECLDRMVNAAAGSRLASLWAAVRNRRDNFIIAGVYIVSIVAILVLSDWYKSEFPFHVTSNYSVETYHSSTLSLSELVTSFVYLCQFQFLVGDGLLGNTVTAVLFALVMLNGFVLVGLRWRRSSIPAELQWTMDVALLLCVAAAISFVIIAQNAHVQLVTNGIRGRYFTIPYYAWVLAFAISVSVGGTRLMPWLVGWSNASWLGSGLIAGYVAAVAVVDLNYARQYGPPSLDLYGRWVSTSGLESLANRLRADRVVAVVGDYWLIWDLQYALNIDAKGTPAVTPVSIRTEAFRLPVFQPIVASLLESGQFRFACIVRKVPLAGFSQTCAEHIANYSAAGAFPHGQRQLIDQYSVGEYNVSIFEETAALPAAASCAVGDIVFRASKSETAANYTLRDDSFVYLSRPAEGLRSTLSLQIDSDQKSVRLAPDSQIEVDLHGRAVSIVTKGCGIFISVAPQPRWRRPESTLVSGL